MARDTDADDDLPDIAPSPSPLPISSLPGHLQNLIDRARGYVEAASSENTRRAYRGRNKVCSKSCAKVERTVTPRLEPA